jgi:tetratricopeptide (TPR) repeat protein
MTVIRFEIVPSRAPDVSRTVELLDAHTLGDLHFIVQDAFELDNDHLYSFYLSNIEGDSSGEYTSGMTSRTRARAASDATLSSLDLPVGKRFLYLFDFGDNLLHHIAVVARVDVEPNAEYPRVVAQRGPAPAQYEPFDDDEDADAVPEDLKSLASKLVALERELDAIDQKSLPDDDELDDDELEDEEPPVEPLPPEWLNSASALATEILERTERESGTFGPLRSRSGVDTTSWLQALLAELQRANRTDDAIAIASRAERVAMPHLFRAERAWMLALAGRAEEARALFEANLRDFPDELDVVLGAGDCAAELNDSARAEAIYRDALGRTGRSLRAREDVTSRLAALLETAGRHDEARALEKETDAIRYAARKDGLRLPDPSPKPAPKAAPAPVKRSEPKVGRNDPCPCGSGKKYKKCHGA